MFQIRNENGYIVDVHILDNDGVMRWHPIRNFGDRQGDARAYKEFDCPELDEAHLRVLIRQYDPGVKYIRVKKHRFARQHRP